jgi:hypothetical protein
MVPLGVCVLLSVVVFKLWGVQPCAANHAVVWMGLCQPSAGSCSWCDPPSVDHGPML